MYRKNLRVYRAMWKLCALVAATLILPALAYADRDHDRDNNRDNDGHRWADHDTDKGPPAKNIPVVPEANAGWVLIPFVGAVLLLSWRQFSRART
jgi:hypothetical protein